MPKDLLREARFDFRGGLVTAVNPDLCNQTELVSAVNTRITATGSGQYGGVTKRGGTQRIHQTALGAPSAILGLTQWDGPSGKQVVAVANGHLYYRNGYTFATAFTDEGTAPFSTTKPAFFMPFRDFTSGAPLVLYIASGGKLLKWTGTVLTDITGTTVASDIIIAYHTRGFAKNTNFLKHVYWSKIGDATSWATGDKTQGGSAMVDVLSGEEIVALEVIGSSLLLAAEDSVMRFTGQDATDIVIAQSTEGISSEIGAVGPLALKRFESAAAMLSDRGPYGVTESNVEPIGEQILPDFNTLDTTVLSKAVVGWNRGSRELLFAVPGPSDSSLNKTVYSQATRLQAWNGKWSYTFGITYLARYEDSTGDEQIIAGCNDGYIRHMDVGSKDDVLYDGTSGNNITMSFSPAPIHFGIPNAQKSLKQMKLQAKIPANANLVVQTVMDAGTPDNGVFVGPTYDNVLRDYRVDVDGVGRRLDLTFSDSSAGSPVIHGFTLDAFNMLRP